MIAGLHQLADALGGAASTAWLSIVALGGRLGIGNAREAVDFAVGVAGLAVLARPFFKKNELRAIAEVGRSVPTFA